MPKRANPSYPVSPDYFDQGRVQGPVAPLQHYETGEAASFSRPYGQTNREALENLITGNIQIIGLDEVRQQYSEQRGEIEKSVTRIADACLGRKPGKHDIFVPLDEGRFALLFAGLSREEALQKSETIAIELVNKLFGELPGGELISVEAAMLDIDDFESLARITSHEDLVNCFRQAIEKTRDKASHEFRKKRSEISVGFRPAYQSPQRLCRYQ